MPVGEMLRRMSSAELTEWAAYAEIEPFGAQWDNWRAGLITSTIANVNRGKGRKAYKASEFMPGIRVDREKSQMLESLAGMRALASRSRKT